jgi:hypothetical protein
MMREKESGREREREKTINFNWLVIWTIKMFSIFPKFSRTNFRELILEQTFRERIFGN